MSRGRDKRQRGEAGGETGRNVHGKVYNRREPKFPADRLQFRTAPGSSSSVGFPFDGAVSNASAPADSRPDCRNRGRFRHIVGVRFRAAGVRFRAAGAASLSLAVQTAAQNAAQQPGETVRRHLDRRGGASWRWSRTSGIRIQRFDPQIQDTGVSLARSLLGAGLQRRRSRGNSQTQQSTSALSGSGPSVDNRHVRGRRRRSNQTLPWGGELHRQLEQRAVHDQRTCPAPSTRSSART